MCKTAVVTCQKSVLQNSSGIRIFSTSSGMRTEHFLKKAGVLRTTQRRPVCVYVTPGTCGLGDSNL